jgi:hypothetical protein
MAESIEPQAQGKIMRFHYRHGDRPIDGYTILRGIGRGGFGEVYYARSDAGRDVALKAILYNEEIELRGVSQCINLKSPHLVSVFDIRKDTTGVPFVIMEYVIGPSLREVLEANPTGLGPLRTAFLVQELGKGLNCLHSQGIVHRDLKPENVFFEDGYVKIGDYGLSKLISTSRQSAQTMSVGTVQYMAPEIGSGNYDRGVDIYALGIMAHELLTGRVPFEGETIGEILLKHLTAEPDLSGIEEPFRAVISRALQKSPAMRQPTVDLLVLQLLADPKLAAAVAEFRPESLSSLPARFRPSRHGGPDLRADLDAPADPQAATIALAALPEAVAPQAVAPQAVAPEARPRAAQPAVPLPAATPPRAALPRAAAPPRAATAPAYRPRGRRLHRSMDELIGRAARRLGKAIRWAFTFEEPQDRLEARPPGRPARLFWVFVGSGLVSGGFACLAALALIPQRGEDSLALLCGAVTCFAYGLFSFHRGLRVRAMGLWRRTLRPFLGTSCGVGAGISLLCFIFFGGSAYGAEDAFVAMFVFFLFVAGFVILYALPAMGKRMSAELAKARSSSPPAALPLPTELRFALLAACGASIAGAVASLTYGFFGARRPWDQFDFLAGGAALAAAGSWFAWIAFRGRRRRVWRTVVRPFLVHASVTALVVIAIAIATDLPMGGDEAITFLFMASIAGGIAIALGILRWYEGPEADPGPPQS